MKLGRICPIIRYFERLNYRCSASLGSCPGRRREVNIDPDVKPGWASFISPRSGPINLPRSTVILGHIACMTRMKCEGGAGGCIACFYLFVYPRFCFSPLRFCSSCFFSVGFPGRLSALGSGSGSGPGSWLLEFEFLVLGSRFFLLPVAGCFTLSTIDPHIPADFTVTVSPTRVGRQCINKGQWPELGPRSGYGLRSKDVERFKTLFTDRSVALGGWRLVRFPRTASQGWLKNRCS